MSAHLRWVQNRAVQYDHIYCFKVCSGIETVIFNYDTFPWKKIIKYHFLILQRKLTQYWGHTNEYLNQKIIIKSLKNDITTIIFLAHRVEQQNDWSEHLIEQFFFLKKHFFLYKNNVSESKRCQREEIVSMLQKSSIKTVYIYICIYVFLYFCQQYSIVYLIVYYLQQYLLSLGQSFTFFCLTLAWMQDK